MKKHSLNNRDRKILTKYVDSLSLMSLATTNGKTLWSATVFYLYDEDLNIYFLSATNTTSTGPKLLFENEPKNIIMMTARRSCTSKKPIEILPYKLARSFFSDKSFTIIIVEENVRAIAI